MLTSENILFPTTVRNILLECTVYPHIIVFSNVLSIRLFQKPQTPNINALFLSDGTKD